MIANNKSFNFPKYPVTKPSLHVELRNRIQQYFDKKGILSTGNSKLYWKAVILSVALMVTYVHLVFFTPAIYFALPECGLLGLIIASVGFNVMHDGGHGSFSQNKSWNKFAAWSINFLGANNFMWNMKHNIIHHSYTNIHGVDDDIEVNGLMRFAPTQVHKKLHKYQYIYFWGLYSLLYIWWIIFTDYKKYFSRKVGEVPLKKMAFRNHLDFWMSKLLHAGIFVVIPIIFCGWLPWLIGFLTMGIIAGLGLSIVFQLAHAVPHTEFPTAIDDSNKMADEFAVHQLKTTANFAMNNKVIGWLVGGLNYQIEHHLFPKVSHIHYPAISKIVRDVCKEYNIPYLSYKTFSGAILEHIRFLKEMGKKPVYAVTPVQ
jgi:linoleoyl-CoA desaturase